MVPTCATSADDRDLLGALLDVLHDRRDRDVDAALEVHRVHAGRDRLCALAHDRLRQHGCGGGAVARQIVGLLRHFAHHLRAHVLELVLKLDFLRDRHAVLGDARRAERLVENDVAALRAERHLHGVGENVDAAQHAVARVGREFHFLGSHLDLLRSCFRHAWPWAGHPRLHFLEARRGWPGVRAFTPVFDGLCPAMTEERWRRHAITPMMSDSFMIRRSSPSIFTSVPPHLPNSTRSPAFRSIGISLPSSSRPPGPTAMISPS